jgi:TetR/AcrR family fatty acid metabolism transcriptional regulator
MKTTMAGHGAKRDSILAAAQKVFTARGFHSAGTAEIARMAGVAEGTLYNYFGSREDIFISLFETRWQDFTDRVRRRISGIADPSEKLKAIFGEALKLFTLNKALAQMFLLENTPGSVFLAGSVAHRVADFLDMIEGIVEEGKRSGKYHPDLDARSARMVIYGTVQGILLSRVLSDKASPDVRRRFRISMTKAARTIKIILKSGLGAPAP